MPTRPLSPWDSPGKNIWSGLPFPSPGDLPNPGTEPGSPTLEADTLTSEPPGKPSRGERELNVIMYRRCLILCPKCSIDGHFLKIAFTFIIIYFAEMHTNVTNNLLCVYIYVCVCVYIYVYVYVCVCVYIYIWLLWVLAVAREIFYLCCGMWNLLVAARGI